MLRNLSSMFRRLGQGPDVIVGIGAGHGFAEAFPAETSSELFELRLLFRRKAHQAYVERVCSAMVQSGWSGDLDRLTIADVPAGRLRDGLLRRRADLACRPPTWPQSAWTKTASRGRG